MSIFLKNAVLVDIDPIRVEHGQLRLVDRRIAGRGVDIAPQAGDEVIDCGGAVVMPGLVNGHTHLYSALAAGMPPAPQQPQNFMDILRLVWWRLDQALDTESIEMSSVIGSLDALRCGTTTLVDHHASPKCIDGSLDRVQRGMERVGLRGVLCYETTDRHGRGGRDAGLEENHRFLTKYKYQRSNRFAGMVGAHALFTLDDETLSELAEMSGRFLAGVHIHVAEDLCDEEICQAEHQAFLVDRLRGHGLLQKESIFAHGTHLDSTAISQVSTAGLTIAHNPRSNMNNAVGYAPVATFACPVMLGTDGIGSDMYSEAKSAWYISQDAAGGLRPVDVVEMLAVAARKASLVLDVTLGKLEVDAAADVIVTDYLPATPLTTENFADHFIFVMGSHHVRHVIADGKWTLRDRKVGPVDEVAVRQQAQGVAAHLWQRMGDSPIE